MTDASSGRRHALTGNELPERRTDIPGPRSRELAFRLDRVESPNITRIADTGPIFWAEARDAVVRDADDNTYIDLTAGFGVATAGHANPIVVAAIAGQAARLLHALGDVHPAEPKVALLERLAVVAPGALSVSVLGSAGAEAVEACLKTALLHTGRPGIVAFRGAYHGLTYGALATPWREVFRAPFTAQLFRGVRFAPFPDASGEDADAEDHSIAEVRRHLAEAERGEHPIGAILVEPIQGRGGFVDPTATFLERLREECDGVTRVLIFDEVYTGFGRTGRWFACEHFGVVPDLMAVGKAMSGSLALSAAIGSPDVMASWPPSSGEAIHTSTFLGNPVACAAALAQIAEIERLGLVDRAHVIGERIRRRTEAWLDAFDTVTSVRGLGLLQGVVMAGDAAAGSRALRVADEALQRGVLVLAEGDSADTLAITPPAVIRETQLDRALDEIEAAIAGAA
jgi:4-aminobutyrate aminotransferase-like enzyme